MAGLKGEFLCSECQARLRIQLEGKKKAQFQCPECESALVVQMAPSGELFAQKPEGIAKELNFETTQEEVFPRSSPRKNSYSPAFVGGLGLIIILVIGFWWLDPTGTTEKNSPPADNTENLSEPETDLKPKPENKIVSETIPVKDSSEEKKSLFENNLSVLGVRVNKYLENSGQFPEAFWRNKESSNGSPSPEEAFSWLAGLDPALEADRSLLPQWSLSWSDPLNDRFVRRRRPDLLNSSISLQASSDRYPASHVVGIAGVGRDAPELPVDSPRAGIFGYSRITKKKDVTDGLSNTMLAAGVARKLSSWADGAGSIKPLTMEPYVNGPDGFGSGQPNGMFVLMADGSVRFLSKKTDPLIVRRMAAIADGLPLDIAVRGEPGMKGVLVKKETKEVTKPNPEVPETPTESSTDSQMAKKDSTELPVPSKEKTISDEEKELLARKKVEEKLAHKILQFELIEAAPLETILVELEAMIGVRVEFDPKKIPTDSPFRKKKVRYSKRNVSFETLLTEILKNADLNYKIQGGLILVSP